jgi:hypothetical protein
MTVLPLRPCPGRALRHLPLDQPGPPGLVRRRFGDVPEKLRENSGTTTAAAKDCLLSQVAYAQPQNARAASALVALRGHGARGFLEFPCTDELSPASCSESGDYIPAPTAVGRGKRIENTVPSAALVVKLTFPPR